MKLCVKFVLIDVIQVLNLICKVHVLPLFKMMAVLRCAASQRAMAVRVIKLPTSDLNKEPYIVNCDTQNQENACTKD